MQFMMMIRATQDFEAGVPPNQELMAGMGKLTAEMAQAGVLLASGGLQPSSKGARIKYSGGKRTVFDGPFAETKELIGGYAIVQRAFQSRPVVIEASTRASCESIPHRKREILMLKIVGIIVAVLIAGVLILAATRPGTFRVQRAASIKAPPEKVFALINDFNRWDAWSPWEKKDPAMKRAFGATTTGKGSTYAWDGNRDVGQGSMEIVDSINPHKVALKLDFIKPFEAHNIVVFTLEPKDGTTHVTWAMEGPVPYFAKIIHLFLDMDTMVGKDFEAGLASMKAAAEK
jgi:uncharacterized protein YndB with AHSA1/START domain